MTIESTITSDPEISASHPTGLRTLFFYRNVGTHELLRHAGAAGVCSWWMPSKKGGLGFTDQTATAVYGLYTAAVYLVTLPGGWIADRLLGAQKTIWYGAIIIMLGHFILAIPSFYAFVIGLLFVIAGTGLLKPNISAIVGELYAPGDPRRDRRLYDLLHGNQSGRGHWPADL